MVTKSLSQIIYAHKLLLTQCVHFICYVAPLENFYAWTIFAFWRLVKYLRSYNFRVASWASVINNYTEYECPLTIFAIGSIANIVNRRINFVL